MKALPSATTPVPTAAAQLSAAPAATGVPAWSPVSAAASGVIRPAMSALSTIGGKSAGSSDSASNTSRDQQRCGTSIRLVPDASLISQANSPVRRKRT